MRDDDPEMFDGEAEGEETPGDQETPAGLEGAGYQQDRTDYSAGSVKDHVLSRQHSQKLRDTIIGIFHLYERTHAHVLSSAVLAGKLDEPGVLDEVERGDDQGEEKLRQPNVEDDKPDVLTKDSGEAGLTMAHLTVHCSHQTTRPDQTSSG